MRTLFIALIAILGGVFVSSTAFMITIVYLVARDTKDRWGSGSD